MQSFQIPRPPTQQEFEFLVDKFMKEEPDNSSIWALGGTREYLKSSCRIAVFDAGQDACRAQRGKIYVVEWIYPHTYTIVTENDIQDVGFSTETITKSKV